MAKAKLTPWFPGYVKPARMGVYERQIEGRIVFSYWDGGYWGPSQYDKDEAYYFRGLHSWFQTHPWRGLAEQPKEK